MKKESTDDIYNSVIQQSYSSTQQAQWARQLTKQDVQLDFYSIFPKMLHIVCHWDHHVRVIYLDYDDDWGNFKYVFAYYQYAKETKYFPRHFLNVYYNAPDFF